MGQGPPSSAEAERYINMKQALSERGTKSSSVKISDVNLFILQ